MKLTKNEYWPERKPILKHLIPVSLFKLQIENIYTKTCQN